MPGGRCAQGAGARGYDGVGRCPGEDARKGQVQEGMMEGEDAGGKMRARGKMPGGRCPQGASLHVEMPLAGIFPLSYAEMFRNSSISVFTASGFSCCTQWPLSGMRLI